MTVIAWDGKQLVCDSQSTRTNKGIKDKNVLKLFILDKPWLVNTSTDGSKKYITAVAGTGVKNHIRNIIELIKLCSDNDIPYSQFKDRIEYTFSDTHSCRIVGVGYSEDSDGDKTTHAGMIYSSSHQCGAWGTNKDIIAAVGDVDYIHSNPKKGKVFKSAAEYASYHCYLKNTCGGKLIAYDPLTDTITSPKHISRKRLEVIAKKLKEIEIQKVNEKYDKLLTPTSC